MKSFECKRAIVEVAHILANKGFAGTYEGNISYKDNDRIYLTPTTQSKQLMSEGKIITVDLDGNLLEGDFQPTSETPMHTTVYKHRPDVKAVVHCHPPFATAYAQANEPIVNHASPEFMILFGEVPCLKYGRPGTLDIIADIEKYIKDYDVVLLGNHGVLAVGDDPEQAYAKIMSLEILLKTVFIRKMTFGDRDCDLSEEECKILIEKGRMGRGYHPDK